MIITLLIGQRTIGPCVYFPLSSLTQSVSPCKPVLCPDAVVPPVVPHYASGQSYLSRSVTPILINLMGGGGSERTSERKRIQMGRDVQGARSI